MELGAGTVGFLLDTRVRENADAYAQVIFVIGNTRGKVQPSFWINQ